MVSLQNYHVNKGNTYGNYSSYIRINIESFIMRKLLVFSVLGV